jgi:hypothetical protein
MRTKAMLLLILLFLVLSLLSALKVPVNQVKTIQNQAILADMAGYVHVNDQTLLSQNINQNERDLPTVMTGFPLSYTSSNTYNGAVYLNMDDDPELEILFGVGKKIVAFNIDGTNVPGWPVTMTQYAWGSPAIGDVTGDGIEDIVCTSRNSTNGNTGLLYAYHKDGTIISGFPVTQAGGGTMNVCLADLAGDNALEILVNVRNAPNGWTYAFTGDGQVLEGWPQQLDTFPGAGISAGDINSDGVTEVISLSYNSLYVFNASGQVLNGFPLSFAGTTYSYSSPVLADLDADGTCEIIFGGCTDAGGVVYVVNHDGTVRNGWPKTTGSWIFATVSLADIDLDGELDIIVGDQTSSATPANYIYAWDKNGTPLNGFPAGPVNAIYTQAGIADIDGDNSPDIMISSNLFTEGYHCFNSNGTPKTGWPLPVGTDATAVTMMTTPVFADFNGDGNIDIAGASTGFSSWLVELYLWDTGETFNEDLAFMTIDGCNVRHDGMYIHSPALIQFPAPHNLTASLDYDQVSLDWDAPEQRALIGYRIYRDNEAIAICGVNTTDYIDTNVSPFTSYSYYVTAVYFSPDGESQPSNTIDISTGEPVIAIGQYWLEGFESTNFPSYGWQNLDQDTDTHKWEPISENAYSGTTCATSASYINNIGALTPDNWLISPKLVLPSTEVLNTITLSFYLAAVDPDWPAEHLSLLISTTDNQISSFQALESWTLDSGAWVQKQINLSAYAEQNIYLAFRHHDCTDMFMIKLDHIIINQTLAGDDNSLTQVSCRLENNYPNPFNPSTTIGYTLHKNTPVMIEVYNIKGQKVRTLVNEHLLAGNHTVTWNGKDQNEKEVSSGIYFYRMTTPEFTQTKKMMLIK